MNWKLALITFTAAAAQAASVLPDTLTNASLTIPVLPPGVYHTDYVRGVSSYDNTFNIVITGGIGTGTMIIRSDVNPYPSLTYNDNTEYIAGLSWLHINDTRHELKGYYADAISFTYGTPFLVHLQAYSAISWNYSSFPGGPLQIDGGTPVRGLIGGYVAVNSLDVEGNPDAVIAATPLAATAVPEPVSGICVLTGLALLCGARARIWRSFPHRPEYRGLLALSRGHKDH